MPLRIRFPDSVVRAVSRLSIVHWFVAFASVVYEYIPGVKVDLFDSWAFSDFHSNWLHNTEEDG